MVRERVPNRVVVIDRDRIGHAHVLHRLLNVVDVVLEAELGGVHPDYDQTLILVCFRPRTNIRKRSQPIDAGVGPELNQNHLSA